MGMSPLRAIKGGSVFTYKDRLYVKTNMNCNEITEAIEVTGIEFNELKAISNVGRLESRLQKNKGRTKEFKESHNIEVNQLWYPNNIGRP